MYVGQIYWFPLSRKPFRVFANSTRHCFSTFVFFEFLAIFPHLEAIIRLFTSGSVLKRTNCCHPDPSLETVPLRPYLWVVDVSRPDKWRRARSALCRQHPQLRLHFLSHTWHCLPGRRLYDFGGRISCYLLFMNDRTDISPNMAQRPRVT